jgi:(p)ppGpp synthase/HD superfamily hydrolase
MTLEERALAFAVKAHEGQVRKYSGTPYVTHPVAVAALVKTVPHTEEMVAAALLHDVVEDCDVTHDTVLAEFGPVVAYLVLMLTDVSRPADGNRAARKAKDRAHTALGSPEAKTVKLADVLHNTHDIVAHDANFAKVYLREMRALLPLLTEGDPVLFARASEAVAEGERVLA